MRMAVYPHVDAVPGNEIFHIRMESAVKRAGGGIPVKLTTNRRAVVREYDFVRSLAFPKRTVQPDAAYSMNLDKVRSAEPMPFITDLLTVIHPVFRGGPVVFRYGRPEGCRKNLYVADAQAPVIEVPHIRPKHPFIIDKRVSHIHPVLSTISGKRVPVIFVIPGDDDRFGKMTAAPVEEGMALRAATAQVSGIAGNQEYVTAFGKAMHVHESGVHPELQVDI